MRDYLEHHRIAFWILFALVMMFSGWVDKKIFGADLARWTWFLGVLGASIGIIADEALGDFRYITVPFVFCGGIYAIVRCSRTPPPNPPDQS